jgi:hypothetical protein
MVETGGELQPVTDFTLWPRNAGYTWRPWTRLEAHLPLPGWSCFPFYREPARRREARVQITAVWGWTEVPTAIKLAALVQAGRLYQRRDNTAGPLNSQEIDDIRLGWSVAQGLDPDVAASVSRYRRLWAVA